MVSSRRGFKDGDDDTAFKILNEAWAKASKGEDAFGLTQEARKLGTLSDDQLAAVRKYEIAVETLGDQHEVVKSAARWIGYLIGIGLVAMFTGFGLWYFKTQRHQDKLLRMQTEEQTPVEEQKGPANAYRIWTSEEEEQLRQAFGEKQSYKQLSDSSYRSPCCL